MADGDEARTGTQTIERAVDLLRHLAAHQQDGSRLSTISETCGLRKSTAHRILACLIREGLVQQRLGGKRYVLGPMLFELGLTATPERLEIHNAARARIAELSEKVPGILKLFFRSGDDFVCSVRDGRGQTAGQDISIVPGSRRPLLYAAGGVAILLALPRREAAGIVRRNLRLHSGNATGPEGGIRRMLWRSLREGIAIEQGDINPGMNGVGLALRNPDGEPFGSISISGPPDIVTLDRLDEYRALFEETARQLRAHPAPNGAGGPISG